MLEFIDIRLLFALTPRSPQQPEGSAPGPAALAFLAQIQKRGSDALGDIIRENGWPSAVLIDADTEAAAFMIVQHADYDPALQLLCHGLMLECAANGETQPGYVACLTDRILCNRGYAQRFGTQIREVGNGCFVPKPIEDPEAIDDLRRQGGLNETLADYLQRINSGDLLLYRPLLAHYAQQLENGHVHESNVIPFPK